MNHFKSLVKHEPAGLITIVGRNKSYQIINESYPIITADGQPIEELVSDEL